MLFHDLSAVLQHGPYLRCHRRYAVKMITPSLKVKATITARSRCRAHPSGGFGGPFVPGSTLILDFE
jgi:hypothetical protein